MKINYRLRVFRVTAAVLGVISVGVLSDVFQAPTSEVRTLVGSSCAYALHDQFGGPFSEDQVPTGDCSAVEEAQKNVCNAEDGEPVNPCKAEDESYFDYAMIVWNLRDRLVAECGGVPPIGPPTEYCQSLYEDYLRAVERRNAAEEKLNACKKSDEYRNYQNAHLGWAEQKDLASQAFKDACEAAARNGIICPACSFGGTPTCSL